MKLVRATCFSLFRSRVNSRPTSVFCFCLAIAFLMIGTIYSSSATPYWASVDLSSLAPNTAFEVEFQLFGGGDIFNAEVLLDNVFVSDPWGDILIDFEDNSFGGFVEYGNAVGTVNNFAGTLDGTGSRLLSLTEDPTGLQWTTIVYQSFVPSVPSLLKFDYQTLGFETGFFGDDQFTVWLRDASFNALLSPGVMGPGDPVVLEVTPTFGVQTNPYTTTAPIPEPTTVLLLSIGILGLIGVNRKKLRRRNSVENS